MYHLSKRKPLLIVFEDLQWIDPTSQELIDRLIDNINYIEATLIATYRPEEYQPQWSGQPHVENFTLSRLSHPEAHEIIKQQTHGKELPKHLVDLIIEKTDGIPLFIEELTKSALESKPQIIKDGSYSLSGELDDIFLPDSLQDILTSRIDRLPEAGKDLAPICATIGRTFSYALLATVTGLNANTLHSSLDQLVDAQLLFKYGQEQDSTYTFKHALIQDAAYDSQLKSKRIKAHDDIAKSIIEAGDSRPESIAYHFQAAGKYVEAFKYWIKAGDNGLKTGATKETVKLLKNANHYLSSFEETDANRPGRLKYYLLLGKALKASGGAKSDEAEKALKTSGGAKSDEAEQAYWNAVDIAEKIGDT